MKQRAFRRVATFTSIAALTGAAGAAAGCGSDSDPAAPAAPADPTATTGTSRQSSGQSTNGGPGADMAARLAKELGISEEKVQAALEKTRPQGGPPTGGGQAPPAGADGGDGQTPSTASGATTS